MRRLAASFTGKNKPVLRSSVPGYAVGWLCGNVLALVRQSVRIRLIGAMVIATCVISFLAVSQIQSVSAAPELELPLDCVSCHQQTLEYHDQLGSGNSACWACHDSTDMSQLRLANDTRLTLVESNRLCGQCHEVRYRAWQEGTHGFPGTVASGGCNYCHNPHRPQLAFIGITDPHPVPTPSAPSAPFNLMMIVGISLLFLIGLTVFLARQERET
ncbi:hypothetical protein ACFLYX_02900 [Chloroflexota bacterium]